MDELEDSELKVDLASCRVETENEWKLVNGVILTFPELIKKYIIKQHH